MCTLSVDLIARCSQLNGLLGHSGRRTAPDGTVSVVPDVTAQLPTSSVAVKAKADPASDRLVDEAGPCPRPEPAECHRVARPPRSTCRRPAVAARRCSVVLIFRVNPRKVPAGVTPFLASLDTAPGTWIPVASDYDPPPTGEVSTTVTHLSIWAPLDWVKSRIAALFKGHCSACSVWPTPARRHPVAEKGIAITTAGRTGASGLARKRTGCEGDRQDRRRAALPDRYAN